MLFFFGNGCTKVLVIKHQYHPQLIIKHQGIDMLL
eukprot:XP_001706282.1 Hypothetical protein GL50803_36167 [Giardia lamblia ATCC 50803]